MPEKDNEEAGLLARRREFFDTYFRKAAEFTQELLRDNETLRYRVLQLEEELAAVRSGAPPTATVRELLQRIEQLEAEKAALLGRVAEVESRTRDYMERYQEIERENNDLVTLYIASTQLQSAMSFHDLCATVVEILLNFVGANLFAVMFPEENGGAIGALVSEGIAPTAVPKFQRGEGVVGRVLETGELYAAGEFRPANVDFAHPSVCVPLKIRGSTVGVIPIWRFLGQKEALQDVDFRIFDMLTHHAAPAISMARLAEQGNIGDFSLGVLRSCLCESA